MYLAYYSLSQDPFSLSPDPDFLFFSPSHKEAIGSLLFCIENRLGFCVLTGEVGTGKTTVIRYYLSNCNRTKIVPVYIFNPGLSFHVLLKNILEELGENYPLPAGTDPFRMLQGLLLTHAQEGRTVVLLIDEAQNIPEASLEQLRMLSNFETKQEKLLQIILIGQPELNDHLRKHSLRQLRQRIAVRATTTHLTPQETEAYIRHRLAIAGGDITTLFSKKSLKEIIRHSQGAPRLINILCANALIACVGYGRHQVDHSIVKEVAVDLGVITTSGLTPVRFGLAAAVMILLGAASAFEVHHTVMDLNMLPQGRKELQENDSPSASSRTGFIPKAPSRTILNPRKEEVPVQQTKINAVLNSPVIPIQPAPKETAPPVAPCKTQSATTHSTAFTPFPAPPPTTRTIRRGDYLTKISLEIYGEATEETLAKVRSANPQIKNPDLIYEGDTLRFPK